MFKNKSYWRAIGSIYVAVGLTVLAKRAATDAFWDLKMARYQLHIENEFNPFKTA